MEIKYNITGNARRDFVKAISEIAEIPPIYMGAPSFSYKIGDWYTVTKDGNLEICDSADSEEVELLIEALLERDYEPEAPEATEATEAYTERQGYSFGLELSEITDRPLTEDTMNNLKSVIANKCELFRKAVGTTSLLAVEAQDGFLWFDWFDHNLSEEQKEIYKTFFTALFKLAENAKRVNTVNKAVENEKFTMRTFLNRIGLSGAKHKALRKELLKNLSGSSAFRYGRPGKTDTVTTICYGKTEKWESREEACKHFFEAICNSEGSERERYISVYTKIMAGKAVCSDETDE